MKKLEVDESSLHNADLPTIVFDGEFLPAIFRTQSYEIARDSVRFVCRGDDYQGSPSRVSFFLSKIQS